MRVSHPKPKNQIRWRHKPTDKPAERTEIGQTASGASLIYAGYPYDPYT